MKKIIKINKSGNNCNLIIYNMKKDVKDDKIKSSKCDANINKNDNYINSNNNTKRNYYHINSISNAKENNNINCNNNINGKNININIENLNDKIKGKKLIIGNKKKLLGRKRHNNNKKVNYNSKYNPMRYSLMMDLTCSIDDFIYNKRNYKANDYDLFYKDIQLKLSKNKLNTNGFNVSK